VGEFLFAAGAAGGVAAPSALIETMARALIDEKPLAEALAVPRVLNPGAPDVTFVERALDADSAKALRERGHRLRRVRAIGRVNAILCPNGFRAKAETCVYRTDPRGSGLATAVQF